MKLLVLTQKIDSTDPVMGFFHRWMEVLATKCDSLVIIALGVGTHDLPDNVRVLSLGKDEGKGRATYVMRFFHYVWRERKNYTHVFVHMNQEYVMLAGVLWRMLGKKISLWYNHKVGTWKTRLAAALAHKIFYTSDQAFMKRYGKAKQMPVGVDTELFTPNDRVCEANTLLSWGRISPVKRIELLIDALIMLREDDIELQATIVGDVSASNMRYGDEMRHRAATLTQEGKISWQQGLSHKELIPLAQKHELFVNMTQSGSFDKTLLEAMSMGLLVVASNFALGDVLPRESYFKEGSVDDLKRALGETCSLSAQRKAQIREIGRSYVKKEHSLVGLVDSLIISLSNL